MEQDSFSLQGKIVLVTGASSGIGAATCIACARAGARVILTGRRREILEAGAALLAGGDHAVLTADLADAAAAEALAENVPAIDGFAHCAGLARMQLLRFEDADAIRKILEVNLLAAIGLTRALVKRRKINRGGSMVYLASNLAGVGIPGASAYAASKAGLVGFVRTLAVEVAPRAVRANTISPGLVETPMTAEMLGGDPELVKADRAKYPLGYGKPEDVAAAVRYFLSDASRWVTASDFIIDGGFSGHR